MTNTLSIRLEPRMAQALENETVQTGLSKAEIVRQALEKRLGKAGQTSVINRHFGVMNGPSDLSTNKAYRRDWKSR
jgi:hypothetical protein